MKKLFLLITLFVFAASATLFSQAKVITGTVTSAIEGEGALPGVSVTVPGTTLGAYTDAAGKYSLTVPDNANTLVFTFVGMKTQEISIDGKSVIDVVLEQDLMNLDEVIVTGVAAGTPKKKMAVSVEKVGEDKIKEVFANSASSALQGKVAGLTVVNSTGEPGAAASILVRGATQITGSQAPLIILDGAIMEGTLGDINVDDIESIEVVKGASASALYGSRAGNGVIAVTTRRGNMLAEGKTEVIVRNEFGLNQLAKKYDLATHHAFQLASDQASYDYTRYFGVTYPTEYNGTESGASGARRLEDDQYMDNPYARVFDHEGDIFAGNNFMTNYVSVGSNLGKTNFLVSFENNIQSGLLVETDGYKRNSFRLNVDHKISPKLSVSASNLYVKSTTQDPGGADTYNGGLFFDCLLYEPDVDFFYPNPDGQPYNFVASMWQEEQENPIYQLWKIEDNTVRNRILGTYNAKYNLTTFLNFEAKYAFEYSTAEYTTYNPYDTYTRSGSDPVYSQGSLYIANTELFSRNAQVTANFQKKIGDFNTRAKVSYLFEKVTYNSNSTNGVDFSLRGVPSFDAISGPISSTSYKDAILAKNYFGILYVDYRDKYIFDGMIRYDGSSLFGSEARWNPYYRVSGAYRISEDVSIPGIQEFKLRAAFGTAGQRPGFSDQYEIVPMSNGQTLGKYQSGNSMLKPSLSKELEIGLNIDFLNRFSFELVRSEINTTDQILSVPLAVQFGGWAYQVRNAGSLNSKVWESSLNIAVARKKDFNYNIGFIFDRVRTKITQLDVPPFQTGPQGQEANKAFYIREGETFGAMYGYSFLKSLDELQLQLADPDDVDNYMINSDGYVIEKGTEGTIYEAPVKKLDENGNLWFGKIGDSNPRFKLAMTNNLSYKGFGLYALLEWKNGGDIYNKSAQWLTRDDRHGMMDQYGKADHLKKTITYYKVFYDVNTQNDFWVEDGSYLKLRELSVSYSLGQQALAGFANGYIKGIRLALIGKNLYTLTKYTGYDPEVQTTDGTQYFAYDFMGYPNYRSYSVSLELKF
ncbi:MAG TPA: SusC/RagA family TonB-linked outer membrane protein [Bacteroidales bacterium]|nr:SusC/RagA family TonB-linked outer membrane protein [Bacteroidales bacterium]HPF02911.1 SusC/RagA family TonB-linked outer membrane protein [Bacteroidales bacterium]HPJ60093.1 SusC/RagA family TonB-linked outer membrane protein [Bacteroidales bacterium]HPR13279.1 SusC/RagA family TonB-linked outer membrane protein [Bacteroidales bacterium]HRW85564.1 SusC/RagA family TonB-linked outer membrane protein [Bacteroidales bacterium]